MLTKASWGAHANTGSWDKDLRGSFSFDVRICF